MTQLIDYEIGDDWDLRFTEWNDLRVVRDEDVLVQRFVFIAEEYVGDMVGTTPTATELSRFSNRLIQDFRTDKYVTEARLEDFSFEDGVMRFTLSVNGVEITDKTTLQ